MLAVLSDPARSPPFSPPGFIEAAQATGLALLDRGEPGAARAANLAYLRQRPAAAPFVAQACTAIGDKGAAFSILDGYYFGIGQWSFTRPRGGDEDLQTRPLFQPPMKPMWSDPQFARLLSRIGLDDYWQKSGSVPDYRRA